MGQIKTKWLQHDQITKNGWTETDIKASALFYQDVHPYLETKDGDFAKRIWGPWPSRNSEADLFLFDPILRIKLPVSQQWIRINHEKLQEKFK